jgi:hypothetical protein
MRQALHIFNVPPSPVKLAVNGSKTVEVTG